MKSLRYLPVLLVLFTMTNVVSAVADHGKTVRVTNNTTYTMSELYASSSDSSADWDTSNNLLAGQTLAPGQSTTITIADGLAACNYDLMAVLYGAPQHAYSYKVNACDDDGGSWTVHQ